MHINDEMDTLHDISKKIAFSAHHKLLSTSFFLLAMPLQGKMVNPSPTYFGATCSVEQYISPFTLKWWSGSPSDMGTQHHAYTRSDGCGVRATDSNA